MPSIGTPPPSSVRRVKKDVSEPVAYGAALALLLAIRLVTSMRTRIVK